MFNITTLNTTKGLSEKLDSRLFLYIELRLLYDIEGLDDEMSCHTIILV